MSGHVGSIFVIEDEFTRNLKISEVLSKEGFNVLNAPSEEGEAVIKKIVSAKPDIILTDAIGGTPDEPLGLIEKLKATPELKSSTIFVYAKVIDVSFEVKLRRLKLSEYFLKEKSPQPIVDAAKRFFVKEEPIEYYDAKAPGQSDGNAHAEWVEQTAADENSKMAASAEAGQTKNSPPVPPPPVKEPGRNTAAPALEPPPPIQPPTPKQTQPTSVQQAPARPAPPLPQTASKPSTQATAPQKARPPDKVPPPAPTAETIRGEREAETRLLEQQKLAQEAEARRKQAEEEIARKAQETEAKLREQQRLAQEAEAKRKQAEEEIARKAQDAEAKLREQQKLAQEAEARRKQAEEEIARKAQDAEAKLREQQRLAQEAEAKRKQAEEEIARKAQETEAKLREQQRLAHETEALRKKLEEETKLKREEVEAQLREQQRLAHETDALRKKIEEETRLKTEAFAEQMREQHLLAVEADSLRKKLEEEKRLKAEEIEKLKNELTKTQQTGTVGDASEDHAPPTRHKKHPKVVTEPEYDDELEIEIETHQNPMPTGNVLKLTSISPPNPALKKEFEIVPVPLNPDFLEDGTVAVGPEEPPTKDTVKDEEDPESSYNLGLIYMDMGMLAEAVREFERATPNPLLRIDALTHAAVCLRRLKNYPGAIEKLKLGLKHATKQEDILRFQYEIGTTFQEGEKLKEALVFFESVRKADSAYRDTDYRIQTIQYLLKRGD